MAQIEFCRLIEDWGKKGVPFWTYMYVPEIHPFTNNVFREREDEAHVLKVHYSVECITFANASLLFYHYNIYSFLATFRSNFCVDGTYSPVTCS